MVLDVNPSPAWTPDERLAVIAQLSVAMRTVSKTREIHRSCIFEVSERIALIATMGVEFLEARRSQLLSEVSL